MAEQFRHDVWKNFTNVIPASEMHRIVDIVHELILYKATNMANNVILYQDIYSWLYVMSEWGH